MFWFGFVGAFCFILFWNSELFSGKHPTTIGHSRCDLSICCLAAPDFFDFSPLSWGARLHQHFGEEQDKPIGRFGKFHTIPYGRRGAGGVFVLLEVPPEQQHLQLVNPTINKPWLGSCRSSYNFLPALLPFPAPSHRLQWFLGLGFMQIVPIAPHPVPNPEQLHQLLWLGWKCC